MSVAYAMQAPSPLQPASEGDQCIVVHGVSWEAYCTLVDTLDVPGLRLAYYRGALEIMSPSRLHEVLKKQVARVVELYALERDIPLYGYGSMTFRRKAKERGVEPDECYVVGRPLGEEDDAAPDIALEVCLTSGGLDKLTIYEGLGVPEVWFWKDDAFHIHGLGPDGYEAIELDGQPRSRFLPDLDLVELATFVRRGDHHQALKDFRDALRRG